MILGIRKERLLSSLCLMGNYIDLHLYSIFLSYFSFLSLNPWYLWLVYKNFNTYIHSEKKDLVTEALGKEINLLEVKATKHLEHKVGAAEGLTQSRRAVDWLPYTTQKWHHPQWSEHFHISN